jgi:hypothetical protein
MNSYGNNNCCIGKTYMEQEAFRASAKIVVASAKKKTSASTRQEFQEKHDKR